MTPKKILWTVLSGVVVIGAGAATRKLFALGWKSVTGSEPAIEDENRRPGMGEALAWAAGIGAAMGVSRVLARRGAGKVWEKATGDKPPENPSHV